MNISFKKKIFLLTSCCLFIWIFSAIFFNSITYNVQSNNHHVRKVFQYVIPQGWGFFTKSPREAMVDLYSVKRDSTFELVSVRNNDPKYLFGLSRESRKIGMEISVLLSQIDDKKWVKIKGFNNITTPDSSIVVDNKTLELIPNGHYMLVKHIQPPWSWRNNIKEKHLPYETVFIHCTNTKS